MKTLDFMAQKATTIELENARKNLWRKKGLTLSQMNWKAAVVKELNQRQHNLPKVYMSEIN